MTKTRHRRALAALKGDTQGSVFVEAALVLPLVVLILAAVTEWGLALYQYHILSTANGAAVRQLIINRGFPDPYTNVLAEFDTWAQNLNIQSNQVTVSIQDSANVFQDCAADAACTTLLDAAEGKAGRVTISYPCEMQFTPQIASPCPIRIETIGLIE